MRLHVDFSGLERVAAKFGSERKFQLDLTEGDPWEPVDVALQSGVEVSIEQIDIVDKLLSYQGRHVILYIRDHGSGVVRAIEDPTQGRKYHLADCDTLEKMRAEGRFNRYVVTQAASGEFEISGFDPTTRREVTGNARLQVCMNCLKLLNYKSYLLGTSQERRCVRDHFDLIEFFETYSTRFKRLPSGLAAKAGASIYTEDWAEVSQRLRAEARYTCEECRVCLEEHKALLHVHHINGIKNDNSRSNLRVLCKDCHRKQPNHQHIFLRLQEMVTIARLRRSQGCTQRTWPSVKRNVDLALRPLLEVAEEVGLPAPELGVEVEGTDSEAFDVAWPESRLGVSSSIDQKVIGGWRVERPGHLLSELARRLPPSR